MKLLAKAVILAVVLAIPAVSFAQSVQPKTRQQVREELVQLESIGYDPARAESGDYPEAIRSAQARLAAKNSAPVANNSGYGSDINGVSQVGR